MKYSKERMIKWLKKDIKALMELAEYYEGRGNIEMAKGYRQKAMENQNVLWMMTDNDHFKRQYRVYFPETN